jgi:CRISPR-associated protein Cmr4
LVGIAREVQTQLPYLPASSIRGKLRAELERQCPDTSKIFLGERLQDGQLPTEGYVWFGDASLLLFPVASFSHQFLWITCPLWLKRWNRWLRNAQLTTLIQEWDNKLSQKQEEGGKTAIASVQGKQIFLQGAILNDSEIEPISEDAVCWQAFKELPNGNGILNLVAKLLVVSDSDCGALVEMGLQQEVRIAMEIDKKTKQSTKTTKEGSFRSEQAIPSETILFFPWGIKQMAEEKQKNIETVSKYLLENLLKQRLQFGGLESLGRGWTENKTVAVKFINEQENKESIKC